MGATSLPTQPRTLPEAPSVGPKARLIAYYLPQYHPIPENNAWWGAGFTEWTNVARARRLFPGHYQPHIPADLGFYDLRLPETRLAQAEMAQSHGIAGFCYYHYWFAGRQLLERPFDEVLGSREPRLPFCLCWANDSWSGVWYGCPKQVLIEQTYPGIEDHRQHWTVLLRAFADDRYMRVDGKPLFLIYRPHYLPDPRRTTDTWRELAHRAGLAGL
jgi:lipopolysaccharide biosynthesis protein